MHVRSSKGTTMTEPITQAAPSAVAIDELASARARRRMRRQLLSGALALVVLFASCSTKATDEQTTGAAPAGPSSAVAGGTSSTTTAVDLSNSPPPGVEVGMLTPPTQPDAQQLKYRYGPIKIEPGQNNITVSEGQVPKPDVDGFIVTIKPNLERSDGSIPPVDVIHLHHGVWLNLARRDPTSPNLPERIFASGEEKTAGYLPPGYGYSYKAKDAWLINYMLHNLLATPDEVFITYELDFIPATAPSAKDIKTAWPVWMDVENGEIYPVFDVIKGTGAKGIYTYPDDDPAAYRGKKKNEWTVDKDAVMIGTAGHLHPGGLYTDLYVDRPGATPASAHVFRSEAMYYEPAGAVSWDVAMTATDTDWRVSVKKGEVLRTTTTYDSDRGSWYESMGIMVVWFADAADATGADPFTTKVDQRGKLTHGHLAENDNHGGETDNQFVDLTTKPDGAIADLVTIADFTYAPGDMSGLYPDVPTVKQGQPLKFFNQDAPIGVGIWHTITACKAPCNKSTGVAYPLADADIEFDSGELGFGGEPTAERDTWAIPTDLPPGTYTYFCRIHPSMRGGFRVTP